MGCDCCQKYEPAQYEKCEELMSRGKKVLSPCGGVMLNDTPNGGSRFTPPKKRHRKKVKHGR